MPSLLHRIASRIGLTTTGEAQRQARHAAVTAAHRVQAHGAQQRRSLLAALSTHDVASWTADGLHINAETSAGLVTARARSRDAALNNGYARRFVGMVRGNVLGPYGVRYQARVRTAAGDLRQTTNARLEAGWAAWGRRGALEVTGRYSWLDIQRLVLRHWAVDGECFVRFRPGIGPHAIQLQLLRADVVPVSHQADLGGGRRIRQGVEIDADGRVLAYHMRRDDTTVDLVGEWAGASQRLVRVPADEVLHVMLADEVGQLRGLPPMATALKRMYQAADFASAGLNKARESAKRGGWLVADLDADGATDPTVDKLIDGTDADGTSYASLHDGTWEKTPPGYEPKPFESDYPNIEYGQFIKDCLRDIASALDVAYITLGNDLEAVNYSSGQLGLEGERTMWMGLQQWFVESFVQPVHERWLTYALVAAPELDSLAFDRLALYQASVRWQPHRWQPLDLLKTTEAQRSRIEARLTSPQRVIAESGDDPDEVLAELREWAEKTADMPPMAGRPAGSSSADPSDPADPNSTAAARQALRLRLIANGEA